MESDDKKYLSFSNKKLKNRKELRIKLTKLSNNYFKPRCDHFINNMRSLNFRIMESSGGKKAIEKEVKESRNFRFGKINDYFIHLTDLSPYKVEISPFIESLKKQFTKEEINIIKKNKDYYILNPFIKDNISLFNDQSLYQVLNGEEKEEEIRKANMRVFHDLNFFNNRRKSVAFGLNNSNSNISNNSLNKSDENNKKNKLPFYQTSLIDNKKKKNTEKNNINLSYYNMKRNKLDIIEKDIRKEVKKRRKEDKKLDLINEKTKNIVYDMKRESQSEIKRILNDENVNNYFNNNYYIANQINFYQKKHRKLAQNETEISFPIINRNQTFSKHGNQNKYKSDFIPLTNYVSNNINNNYKNEKEKYLEKKMILYKKRKMNELNKKREEKEQKILRDINRKIKSIYDNLKNKE